MKQSRPLLASLLATLVVAGCGPTLILTNATQSNLRFNVSTSGGNSVTAVAKASGVDLEMALGSYTVRVIDEEPWVAAMKEKRTALIEKLLDPTTLSATQVAGIVAELDGLTTAIDKQTSGARTTCSGKITDDSDGQATVSVAQDGRFIVACAAIPAEDPPFWDSPFW